MITITRNEEVVLNQIMIFNIEYPDGVPVNLLRKELGFHEYDLVHILEELQDKGLVVFNDNKASLSESEKEVKREQEAATYLINQVGKASSILRAAADQGLHEDAEIEGVQKHLDSIKKTVEAIEDWLSRR